jgi:xylulokinase
MFEAGLIVESHVAKDTYLISGYSPSALMLEWFRDNYAHEEIALQKQTGTSAWAYLMEKAEKAPCGSNGAFFLPHFAGTGAPVNDNRALGAFVGLSMAADKGSMIRAMIEGLDYQFRGMLEAMEGALQGQTQKIIVVGGASRNRFWIQNKADVTGKMIEVPDMEEATTLGAALLAGIGVGIYTDEQEAYQRTFKPGKMYEPNISLKARYDNYFTIYKEVYSHLKPMNWKIFDEFRR